MVRNGLAQARKLTLGAGTVELRHRGLMTDAMMNKEVAAASPAGSCRLICGVHPK